MKLLSRASVLGATLAAASVVSAGSAFAMTVEQTQELNTSASTSTTVNCSSGNCSATGEASSSSTGKQTQHVEVPEVSHSVVRYGYRAGRVVWVPSTTVVMMNDGQVRLSWPMRGGTCHVRYTEATQRSWKYATAASCDDGGVTIGGLQAGLRYKFQVRQDNGAWSRVMTGRAH